MVENKTIILIIGFLIVGYFALNYFGINIGDVIGQNPVKLVECEVRLSNPVYIPLIQEKSDVYIKNIECFTHDVDRCNLMNIKPYSVSTYDSVQIKMTSDGKKDIWKGDVYETTSPLIELKLCVGEETNTATFQVLDKYGKLVTKSINPIETIRI